MSHIVQPLTLPVHPQLLNDINEMSIAIKVWHFNLKIDNETMVKLHETHKCPTWDDIEELLMKCHRAINEQRQDPRKY